MIIALSLIVYAQPTQKTQEKTKQDSKTIKDNSFLNDAIRGLMQNDQIIISKQNEVKAYFNSYEGAKSPFMPKVDAYLSHGYHSDKTESYTMTDEEKDRSGLPKGFPGRFESPEGQKISYKQTKPGIRVTYNLFNGLGDVAQLKNADANVRVKSFEYLRDVSKEMLDLISSLITLRAQKQSIISYEVTGKSLKSLIREAGAKLKEGRISVADLSQAESRSAKNQLDKSGVERELIKAIAMIEEKTGLKINQTVEIQIAENLPGTYEEAEKLMLQNNAEIQAAKAKIDMATERSNSARSGFLPKLNLTGSVEKNIITNSEGITARDRKQLNHAVGLELTQNLFNGFKDTNDYKAAAQMQKAARHEFLSVCSQNKIALRTAWQTYNAALEDKKLHETAVRAAREAYNNVLIQYQNDVKAIGDTVEEAERLAYAEIRKAEHEKLLLSTSYQLKMLIGRLTPEQFGVNSNFNPFRDRARKGA